MSTKLIGVGLIVVGVLIIAVALLAGRLGLSHSNAIGTSKMLMAAVGLIVAVVGGVLTARKKAA
ncbi:MAG: hypothetical protein ABSE06_06285 [Anaerolineaceae bacterium]|jgi:hypothetical protein